MQSFLQSGSKARAIAWPFALANCGFALAPASEQGRDLLAQDGGNFEGFALLVCVAVSVLCFQVITVSGVMRRLAAENVRGFAKWSATFFGFIFLPAGALRFGQETFDVLFVAGQPLHGLWFDTVWFLVAVSVLGVWTLFSRDRN
jgi:hypothetical protein